MSASRMSTTDTRTGPGSAANPGLLTSASISGCTCTYSALRPCVHDRQDCEVVCAQHASDIQPYTCAVCQPGLRVLHTATSHIFTMFEHAARLYLMPEAVWEELVAVTGPVQRHALLNQRQYLCCLVVACATRMIRQHLQCHAAKQLPRKSFWQPSCRCMRCSAHTCKQCCLLRGYDDGFGPGAAVCGSVRREGRDLEGPIRADPARVQVSCQSRVATKAAEVVRRHLQRDLQGGGRNPKTQTLKRTTPNGGDTMLPFFVT